MTTTVLKLLYGDKSNPTRTLDLNAAGELYLRDTGFTPDPGPEQVVYSGRSTGDGQRRVDSGRDNAAVELMYTIKADGTAEAVAIQRKISRFVQECREWHEARQGGQVWLQYGIEMDASVAALNAPVIGQPPWQYWEVLEISARWPSGLHRTIKYGAINAATLQLTCAPLPEGLRQRVALAASALPVVEDAGVEIPAGTCSFYYPLTTELDGQWSLSGWWTPNWASGDSLSGDRRVFEYYQDANNYFSLTWTEASSCFTALHVTGGTVVTGTTNAQTFAASTPLWFGVNKAGTVCHVMTGGTVAITLAASNVIPANGYLSLGSSYGTATLAADAVLDAWRGWETSIGTVALAALYTDESTAKTGGEVLSPPPFAYHPAGGGTVHNITGTLDSAAKYNYLVMAGIPGDEPALTEWQITPGTTAPALVYWLGLKTADASFTPGSALWLDYSGTTDTGASSGDAYKAGNAPGTLDYSIPSPANTRGRVQVLARMNASGGTIDASPYYKLGSSDKATWDSLTISGTAWALRDLGDMWVDWPQATTPAALEGGMVAEVDDTIDITSSLVAYWNFNETGGTATRVDTVGDNDLVVSGSVGFAGGKLNNAADFTGTPNYLSIADNAALSFGDEAMSVACWVWLDSKAANASILGKWAAAGDRDYTLYYLQSSDRFAWAVSTDGSAAAGNITAGASPSTATWYFLYAYHNPTTNLIGLSVNNGAFGTASVTGGIHDGTAAFEVGRQGTDTQYLDGRVDAVGVWGRALTSAEIASVYNSGAGREYPYVAVNLDYIHWLPYPVCRLEADTLTLDTGDYIVATGGDGWVVDATDNSQLQRLETRGQVDARPNKYNYVFFLQGDTTACDVTKTATVAAWVTPRYLQPGR